MPVSALAAGDRVLVRPGENIPADGTILDGHSAVDEGLVTGETLPRIVDCGAAVYAGSVNGGGALTVNVIAAGAGTLVDEVERLLDKATAAKSRSVRLADRAARLYAPVVHTAAALTALGWLLAGASLHTAIVTAIAVLIITCPCAIALAIPAVQVVAAGQLFRAGIILNNGDAIERMAEIDTVVFDKTGTLTLPEPVIDTSAIATELVERAARLALSSRHPLAAALGGRAGERIPYPGAVEEPGRGVRALIDGEEARLGSFGVLRTVGSGTDRWRRRHRIVLIAFVHAGRSALIPIRQRLRPDAIAVVAALAARGLNLVVLSGDRPEAVRPVAQSLGITDWHAGLTPKEKIDAIERLKSRERRILMVGDGLNDAPALAAAHASLSPIAAAHLTQAHADALFLGDRLGPVLYAVRVTWRARALMRQNLALAAMYNALAVPVAMAGLATPLIAAAAMSGSSILVTLNALRAQLVAPGQAADRGCAAAGKTGKVEAEELPPASATAPLAPAAVPAFAGGEHEDAL